MNGPAPGYQHSGVALFRAGLHNVRALPELPESRDQDLAWLRDTWSSRGIADAIEHASPDLAGQVQRLLELDAPQGPDLERAVRSVGRYLLRAGSRATPFGLFAGVALARFAAQGALRLGDRHRVVARPASGWLNGVIDALHEDTAVTPRLRVQTNDTAAVRGDRLLVASRIGESASGELSVRHTRAVQSVMSWAAAPVALETLETMLCNEFASSAGQSREILRDLLRCGLLVSCLRAPSTQPDPLAHLLGELHSTQAAELLDPALYGALVSVHQDLRAVAAVEPEAARDSRCRAADLMRQIAVDSANPVALDVAVDAAIVLPETVGQEAARAAGLLARLSPFPYGAPAWKQYHQRFYERFGIGSMVPVMDVVADSGIGWPDGFPGTPDWRRPAVSDRDHILARLAQEAALVGASEIVLDETLLCELSAATAVPRIPPHLEVGCRVHSEGFDSLQSGSFVVEVTTVSRGAGVGIGRFLSVLDDDDQVALVNELGQLPTADEGTIAAQLSFSPVFSDTSDVARAPQVLPTVVSLGEACVPPADAQEGTVLTVADLAVGCDGRRLYLAAPALGQRVEVVGMHALNLIRHTPVLARFLIELSRAQCTMVTQFDWGAASQMPYLPRIRHGRVILSPARWRVQGGELDARVESRAGWDSRLRDWQHKHHLPHRVRLREGDKDLALDLAHAAHREILRGHLARHKKAVLLENPWEDGWFDGRPHEIVVPLRAVKQPSWPRLPRPTLERIIDRTQPDTPATSPVLLVSVYGDIRRQDELLAVHVPRLLTQLDSPPWWFVRFRDPDQHLRLRLQVPTPSAFGHMAGAISSWADELHRAGLVREIRYPTSYPETGRWGSGDAWKAAENVFRTDSTALLPQIQHLHRSHHRGSSLNRRSLIAAHNVTIATAFLGDTAAAMNWLIDHVPATAPAAVPRDEFRQAVLYANPTDDWAALRLVPGGAEIVDAWSERDAALVQYRKHLPGPDTAGVDLDDVLGSLLHVHFVRAVAVDFPEEAICLYLTRAAALAWTARSARRTA